MPLLDYDTCARCGADLEGAPRVVGLCHQCVQTETHRPPRRLPVPGYRSQQERDTDTQKEHS
jgi:predicted amidophosphoribosyltransferase